MGIHQRGALFGTIQPFTYTWTRTNPAVRNDSRIYEGEKLNAIRSSGLIRENANMSGLFLFGSNETTVNLATLLISARA